MSRTEWLSCVGLRKSLPKTIGTSNAWMKTTNTALSAKTNRKYFRETIRVAGAIWSHGKRINSGIRIAGGCLSKWRGQTRKQHTKLNKQEDPGLWIGIIGEQSKHIQDKSSNKRMYGEKETICGTLSQLLRRSEVIDDKLISLFFNTYNHSFWIHTYLN